MFYVLQKNKCAGVRENNVNGTLCMTIKFNFSKGCALCVIVRMRNRLKFQTIYSDRNCLYMETELVVLSASKTNWAPGETDHIDKVANEKDCEK